MRIFEGVRVDGLQLGVSPSWHVEKRRLINMTDFICVAPVYSVTIRMSEHNFFYASFSERNRTAGFMILEKTGITITNCGIFYLHNCEWSATKIDQIPGTMAPPYFVTNLERSTHSPPISPRQEIYHPRSFLTTFQRGR